MYALFPVFCCYVSVTCAGDGFFFFFSTSNNNNVCVPSYCSLGHIFCFLTALTKSETVIIFRKWILCASMSEQPESSLPFSTNESSTQRLWIDRCFSASRSGSMCGCCFTYLQATLAVTRRDKSYKLKGRAGDLATVKNCKNLKEYDILWWGCRGGGGRNPDSYFWESGSEESARCWVSFSSAQSVVGNLEIKADSAVTLECESLDTSAR